MKGFRLWLLLVALLLPLLLTGCKTTFAIQNTTVSEVIIVLEDYVGTHGYKITYRDDELGSFRISMGNFFIPETSETTKVKEITTQLPQEDSNQPLTSYEETTWKTVRKPSRYVEASARISLTQQDENVLFVVETNDAAGSSLDDLTDYFKEIGYVVQKK
ncbi:MAG: hypothetical protein ABIE84_01380 [bacterium]